MGMKSTDNPIAIASLDQYTPVTGRLPVDGSGATQPISATTLPLPTGAATETTLGTRVAEATFTARINTNGQKTMAASTPVVLPSDQSAIPVSGTVTANQGTGSANDWRSDQRRGMTILFASIDVAALGDNTIVTADATKKVKVCQYTIVADAAVAVRWKSGAGTNLSGAMSNAANGGEVSPFVPPSFGHLLETAVNQALVLNLSAAVGARGHLTYFLEA